MQTNRTTECKKRSFALLDDLPSLNWTSPTNLEYFLRTYGKWRHHGATVSIIQKNPSLRNLGKRLLKSKRQKIE